MLRKFAIVAATMVLFTGFTIADDEKPFEKLMSKINTKTAAIRKVTRTEAAYKKGAESIAKDTEEILKLAKESRTYKEFAEKEKKPQAEWEKLTDDMIHATEALAKISTDKKATYAQAKEAFTAYNKTCTRCHNVFKKED